jgi:tetratricopeptide (TPR) repeat protein
VKQVLRGPIALSAFLAAALLSPSARADAEAECRSQVPTRVIPGCTERLTTPNLTVPQRVAALQFRSWANTDIKAFEAAEADVNEIFKIEPNSAVGYGARGRLRHFLGNNDLALNDYNQSVALAQNKYVFLLNRGLFFIRTLNFEPARIDYEAAMVLDPKKAAPYLGRAKVHRHKNDEDAALKDLDTAVSVEPDQAPSYLDRGDLLLTMKQPRRALADFDKALALLKTSSRATRGRETALGMLSTDGSGGGTSPAPTQPAAPATAPAPPAKPAGPVTASPAPAPPAPPNAPTAPKPVQPASTPAAPTDALFQEALDLRKAKKAREALVIYDKILAADPENARAMLARATTFEDADEYRDAYKAYDVLKKSKATQDYKILAIEGMTRIFAKAGDHKAAVTEATEALKLNAKSDEALFWRGFSNVRLHRFTEAIVDFRKAEQNLRSASWEGYALAASGDYTNALARADGVTKANDKLALPYATRARVALAKGDVAKAEEENRRASQLATMPEVMNTAQLILLAKLMKQTDAPLAAKRD